MRPNSLPQPRSSCLPLWSGPHLLATTFASTTGATRAANGNFLPNAPCLNPVVRLVWQGRDFFYLAVTCRLHIRGQRAAPDTWRRRFRVVLLFSTRSPQVLQLVDMCLALHPLVSLRVTRCHWVSDRPRLARELSAGAVPASVRVVRLAGSRESAGRWIA